MTATIEKEKTISLNELSKQLDTEAEYTVEELEQGISRLEKLRDIRKKVDLAANNTSQQLLDLFTSEGIEEYYYKDKVVKPGSKVSYDCSKLEVVLPLEVKSEMYSYLPFKLNRSIIDQAVEDGVLGIKAFEEFVKVGLVERNVRNFIKFCDPEVEENRLKKLNNLKLKEAITN